MNEPKALYLKLSPLGRAALSLIWTNLARSKKNVAMSSIVSLSV